MKYENLKPNMYKTREPVVLASASPRRKDMFERLGIEFEVVTTDVEDESAESQDPLRHAMDMARLKAQAAHEMTGDSGRWYLGVDTVVVLDGRMLGKPAGREQAASFLRALSGSRHEVISGWCIIRPGSGVQKSGAVISTVKIKALDHEEIEAYVRTDEPLDKAGGYAVQGIGAFMVERIEGSYTNVVGMPLAEVIEDMKSLGVLEAAGDSG